MNCIFCDEPFTSDNVHSDLGWKEVAISKVCEDCFDSHTEELDDDEEA
jgi:hypothetical protein